MGDRAGADLPVHVEGFDRITERLSRGDKSDINIRCGIGRQGCDHLPVAIDLIAVFAVGVVRPGHVHRHGGAAGGKFAGGLIDRPDGSVRYGDGQGRTC